MEVTGKDPFEWDAELSPRGRLQAQELCYFLRAKKFSPDVAISSPLTRAIQTMQIGLPPVDNPTVK